MPHNYYEILGVTRDSDSIDIKKAYKKLALQYHPDRNQDKHESEEMFKLINEAYQVLSDPVNRSKYNHQLEYREAMSSKRDSSQTWDGPVAGNSRPPQPIRKTKSAYKIDKEYWRVQKILVVIFFSLLGAAYGLNQFKQYRIQWAEEARIEENQALLDSATTEFKTDNFELAFSMIDRLIERNITDFNFYVERDSMIEDLRKRAMISFQAENYRKAADLLQAVRTNEWRERTQTLELLSTSYARAGMGSKASSLLENKLKEEPTNVSLLYYTAYLHSDELNDPEKAISYLEKAKNLFRENHIKMYGQAFEMLVKPKNIPEVYFRIFDLSGKINQLIGDYSIAYTDCNWAIFIRPKQSEPYLRRIDAAIHTGQTGRLCRDINTLSSMGVETDSNLVDKYCNS